MFNKIRFLLTDGDSCHLALSQLTLRQGTVLWVSLTKAGFATAAACEWPGHKKTLGSSSWCCTENPLLRQPLTRCTTPPRNENLSVATTLISAARWNPGTLLRKRFYTLAPKPGLKQEKPALILPYYIGTTAIHLWSHCTDLCAKTFTRARNRFICSCSSLPCCFTTMLNRVFAPPSLPPVFQVAANPSLKHHGS